MNSYISIADIIHLLIYIPMFAGLEHISVVVLAKAFAIRVGALHRKVF